MKKLFTAVLAVLVVITCCCLLLDERATKESQKFYTFVKSSIVSLSKDEQSPVTSTLTLQPRPPPWQAAAASLWSWDEQPNYSLPEKHNSLLKALKSSGLEPTSFHDFKSPYIIPPITYSTIPEIEAISNLKNNNSRKVKLISLSSFTYEVTNTKMLKDNSVFRQCPVSECKLDVRGNRKSIADLVIFHVVTVRKDTLPPPRPMGQIWAMASWEPPPLFGYPRNYEPWKNVFNWTFTYRTTSDVFGPYGKLAWRDRDTLLSDKEYLEIASRKNKTAVWWVSACHRSSKRLQYVKQMQKYVDVDIYGRCGPLKCDKSKNYECVNMLNSSYKFYLAFENSFCEDYVTEKFFRNFMRRQFIIPVVRGGFDYDKYIPRDVLVNAAHFKSARELAEHLKALGSDTVRYAAMLREKDKLVAFPAYLKWCDICEKLHTTTEHKTIPDIREWSHTGTCHDPVDL